MSLLSSKKRVFFLNIVFLSSVALMGCGGSSGSKKSSSAASLPASSLSSVSSVAISSGNSSSLVAVSSVMSSSINVSSINSSIGSSSSSNSSSSVAAITTTYKVHLNIPPSFIHTYAGQQATSIPLTHHNFALLAVNLAGDVTARYTLKESDIAKTDESHWDVKTLVTPRVDTVIVADISKAIDLAAVNNIHQEGLIYSPITTQVIDIDTGSTSAYNNLLAGLSGSGTFQQQNIDPAAKPSIAAVESLINTVQNLVDEEEIADEANITAALAAIEAPVKNIVAQEVINIKHPLAGTAVGVIRDEGGLFSYSAAAGEIVRSALVGNTSENQGQYNGITFVNKLPTNNNERIVLTRNGWVAATEDNKVSSYHDDGSVTLQNIAAGDVGKTVSVKQAFDLSGRNILTFLQSTTNANAMTGIINPAAVFASGAKGYRLETQAERPIYSLYVDAGDEAGKCWGTDALASASGGNCVSIGMTTDNNIFVPAVAGYNNIFSQDVPINSAGYRAVVIGEIGPNKLEVQIINDAAKTLKFYENAWGGIYSKLLATSTWSEINLPHLSVDNKAVYLEYPEELRKRLWAGPETTHTAIVQQNNYLREIQIWNKGASDEAVSFNAVADTSITTATDYKNPLVGVWTMTGSSDTFIFSDNNTFTHVKSANTDENCETGTATGTYSWNPVTFIVDVKLNTDSTAVEADDSCSIDGKATLVLEDNQLTLISVDGQYTFTRSPALGSDISGTWVYRGIYDYAVLTFTDTRYFLSDYDPSGIDSSPFYGTESGTYSYDAGAGLLSYEVLFDTNGMRGFSNANNEPFPLVITGDSMTLGDGVIFQRLK